MTTTNLPTEAETWMLLASVVFDSRGPWRTQVAERTGMPFSRFRALRRLERAPLSGAELADRLAVDAPATSVIVSDLADRGLVSKTSDPADGRRKIISLTDAGRQMMDRVREMPDPAPVVGALSPQERQTLHTLLLKMQEGAR